MSRQTVTERARGRALPSKRSDNVQVMVPMTREQHAKLKAVAVKNCRALGQECLYRILVSLEAEEAPAR